MIQPPFRLYNIHVEPSRMNSPQVPAVRIWEAEVPTKGHRAEDMPWITQHFITPDQARQFAAELLDAADRADPNNADSERDRLAQIIWEASRADEGTISATGANVVAEAIRTARLTELA